MNSAGCCGPRSGRDLIGDRDFGLIDDGVSNISVLQLGGCLQDSAPPQPRTEHHGESHSGDDTDGSIGAGGAGGSAIALIQAGLCLGHLQVLSRYARTTVVIQREKKRGITTMRFLTNLVLMEEDLIPAIEVDPNSVTPGVIGFIMTFGVMIAVLLLVLDMVRRVRRVRYRQEIADKLDGVTPPAEDR